MMAKGWPRVAAVTFGLGIAMLAWPNARAGEPVSVRATDFEYDPKELSIPLGETTFRLMNDGVRRHNLVIYRHTDGAEIASELIRPGTVTEWTVTFDQPGRYHFFCTEYSHMDRGMVGYAIVE